MRPVKAAVSRYLSVRTAAREAILCQPDSLSEEQFDALVETWLSLLLLRLEE
jgi:hypothetical protein